MQTLAKLPGLGPRSARRIVLHLLKNRSQLIPMVVKNLQQLSDTHKECSICGYMDARDPCFFCTSPQRDPSLLCIVAETGDVWALEKAAFFKGRYHILGGVMSAFTGKQPENLFINSLQERLTPEIKEIILAIDGTVEGQMTLHYLIQKLSEWAPSIKVSNLARGMPVGGGARLYGSRNIDERLFRPSSYSVLFFIILDFRQADSS